jgi:glycerophosphoryl diester phosphodiesterase
MMKKRFVEPARFGIWAGAMMMAAGLMGAEPPAPALVACSRPLVIGHRGFSSVAPENTLPSFKLALAAGADMVELDTYHSRDGVPVVFHDRTLDRTTDATNRWGRTKITPGAKTLAELKTLDAGRWFAPCYAGTRIPTLVEALDTIQGGGGITLIERKQGDAATMARLLREKGLVNHVVVQAFDWEFLRELHALLPGQVLGALGAPGRLADGRKPTHENKHLDAYWLDQLALTGAKLAVWNRDVSRESVALAHQRGLKVYVYTIDDAPTVNQLLDLGVDGIITNNPAQLWRTLALRAERTD